jgi:hypothetical protein
MHLHVAYCWEICPVGHIEADHQATFRVDLSFANIERDGDTRARSDIP